MYLSAPNGGVAQMLCRPDGQWVSWSEYEKLQAEVERLRKAGDAMAKEIVGCYRGEGYDPADCEALSIWNAAKEGKPSEQKSPSFIEDLGNGVEKHDLLFRYPAKEGKPSV
jgi:hypothetical protein